MNTQKIFLSVLFLVLGVMGGYGIGFWSARQSSEAVFQKKLERFQRLFPAVDDIRSLSGTVETIKDSVIMVSAEFVGSPLEDLPLRREVAVGSSTKLLEQKPKDPLVFQKEIAAYPREKLQQNPPNPFIERTILLQDIKTGDHILVEADENIKTKTQFTASRVILRQLPASSSPLPQPASF